MVERWSSKSHTWVRFLLLLLPRFLTKNSFYWLKTHKIYFKENFNSFKFQKKKKANILFTPFKFQQENFKSSVSLIDSSELFAFSFFFFQKKKFPNCHIFFSFKNLKKNSFFFLTNVFILFLTFKMNSFLFKLAEFSYFYNFFYFNNFLHLSDFFRQSYFSPRRAPIFKSVELLTSRTINKNNLIFLKNRIYVNEIKTRKYYFPFRSKINGFFSS